MEFFQALDYLKHKNVRVKVPAGEIFASQEKILLKTSKDTVVAKVISGNRTLEGVKIDDDYSFVRRLSVEEFSEYERKDADARQRVIEVREHVEKLKLKMHVFSSKTSFDNKVLVFFFTSEGNVDFRELVKELAAKYKKRILLRRVSPHDRAKIVGGIGLCGRESCCSFHNFGKERATMDAVRDQGIMIKNNKRIFGLDGKIKSCMAYERSYYQQQRKYLPHIKQTVRVNDRRGRVVGLDILNKKVRILFDEDIVDIFDVSEIEYENKIKEPIKEIVETEELTIDLEGVGI